jgi:hypothetical protein
MKPLKFLTILREMKGDHDLDKTLSMAGERLGLDSSDIQTLLKLDGKLRQTGFSLDTAINKLFKYIEKVKDPEAEQWPTKKGSTNAFDEFEGAEENPADVFDAEKWQDQLSKRQQYATTLGKKGLYAPHSEPVSRAGGSFQSNPNADPNTKQAHVPPPSKDPDTKAAKLQLGKAAQNAAQKVAAYNPEKTQPLGHGPPSPPPTRKQLEDDGWSFKPRTMPPPRRRRPSQQVPLDSPKQPKKK